MTRSRKYRQSGFSVLELMNLLTLASVLAILGMFIAVKYVRVSKTAEAVSSVEAIARGAAAYFDESDFNQPQGSGTEALRASRHFPPSSHGTVPLEINDVQGKRYKSAMADWLGSPWHEIRFSMPQPQFYAYSFESDGAGPSAKATAEARGDLDANGVWSTYHLAVTADDSATAHVANAIERTNPEE